MQIPRLKLGLIHTPHPRLPRIGVSLAGLLPPAAVNWHSYIDLTDMDALGNDGVGNCVTCGTLRAIQIQRAVAGGDKRKPTTDEALALYRTWSGYDGTPATDVGTRSDVAAARWASEGVQWGEQWLDVPIIVGLNPAILSHLQAAIAFFGPVQLDLNMPACAQRQSVWDVADGADGQPGSWGAHRVCVGRYNADSFHAVTWGFEQPMTPAFVEKYALDCTASISRGWLDTTGRSPANLDLDALEVESRSLAA